MARPLRVFLCHALVAVLAAASIAARAQDGPILVLMGVDGWRWDYLERFEPPVLTRLASNGVRADGLIPVFPSKTFPNHYTIVTGLRPARHGLISNNIVDPRLPGRFSLSDREVQQDTRWWGGEPLWVTAERQGQIAATMFWPGSDVEIAGDRPTLWMMYEHELPNADRVDRVLSWLDRPAAERPSFVTLYFSDVDSAGHEAGPDAPETRAAALAIDDMIGRLIRGVERLGLAPLVNYVVVSDHGMSALSRDRVIVLDDYLDLSTVEIVDGTPVIGLAPRPGVAAEEVYAALHGRHPALAVFTRDTLPARYGLRGHPRLPEVIGIADDGWHVTTRAAMDRAGTNGRFPGGNHGYDPEHRSMHGLFIAAGPAFRTGEVVPAFENVHVYELLCRVLGLRPAPNDGNPDVTAGFLR